MARYVLRIGDTPCVDRVIDANSDAEVFGIALTAVAEYVRSSFPPPPHIELTVMDGLMNPIGVLKLSCDLGPNLPPLRAASLRTRRRHNALDRIFGRLWNGIPRDRA